MTDKTKEFLVEFRDLMKKYGAEFEAIEETHGYNSYCKSIELTIQEDIGHEYIELGRCFDANDIDKMLK